MIAKPQNTNDQNEEIDCIYTSESTVHNINYLRLLEAVASKQIIQAFPSSFTIIFWHHAIYKYICVWVFAHDWSREHARVSHFWLFH